MHWAFQFLVAFLAGFFAGFTYRTFTLRHQLLNKEEFDELLTEYGYLKKPFAIHWYIEMALKLMIIAYIAMMIYFSVFEGISKLIEILSINFVQIGSVALFGFFAGYSYKAYRIKFLLINPEKMLEMYEGYAGVNKPETFHLIDKIIKLIIIALIAAMIYFSVY